MATGISLIAKHYNRAEAAALLKEWGYPIARTTLEALATRGGGPKYCKWGRRPLYTKDDLQEWVSTRLKPCGSSSSEFKNATA